MTLSIQGILSYLKGVYDALKGKPHDTVMIPKNQGEFEQVIFEGSKLEGNIEVKKYFSLINIVYVKNEGSTIKGITLSENKDKSITKEVAQEKEKEPQRKVNLLPSQYEAEYTHLRSGNKYTDYRILEIVNKLDKTFQSKVLMAIEIEELYRTGNIRAAESDKEDFAYQYGTEEQKFVDLWTQGYLKKILIRIYEINKTNPKSPYDIKRIIGEFVANSDTIFFVHRYLAWKRISIRIIYYAGQNKEYIALHALGSVAKRARKIDSDVNQKLVDTLYTPIVIKNESKAFSKVWYKGRGIETYKLLLEVI